MGFYVLMLYKALSRLKQSTVPLNFGRIIIANWCSNLIRPGQEVNILDIGMGPGTDLLNIKNSLLKKYPDSKISLYGLDSYLPSLERAKNLGIEGKLGQKQSPLQHGEVSRGKVFHCQSEWGLGLSGDAQPDSRRSCDYLRYDGDRALVRRKLENESRRYSLRWNCDCSGTPVPWAFWTLRTPADTVVSPV